MHLTQETAETLIQIEKTLLYPINIHIPQSNHQNEIYPLGYTDENKIFDTKTLSATMFRGSKNPTTVSYKYYIKFKFD